jgi:lipid A 4'-phosphatase
MSLYGRYLKARIFKRDWLYFIFCLVFFAVFPNFDLLVSSMLWTPEHHFEFSKLTWVYFSYVVFSKIHFVYLGALIYFLIVQTLNKKLFGSGFLRKHTVFLLVALLLGPGFVVNFVFKENWGRARPHEVVEFGGVNRYTPPLEISKECDGNCSFVSGHASGAFFLLSLSWVFRRKRWFWIGLSLGCLVGIGRVLQGGHFVSDIVFAFWAVYLSSLLTAMWFGMKAPLPTKAVPKSSSKLLAN